MKSVVVMVPPIRLPGVVQPPLGLGVQVQAVGDRHSCVEPAFAENVNKPFLICCARTQAVGLGVAVCMHSEGTVLGTPNKPSHGMSMV